MHAPVLATIAPRPETPPVVIDLVVNDDGRVRDLQIVEGLGHGLSEAAAKALRECRFSPGERDGKLVPVKIRGFKIHFMLQDAN